MVFFIFIQISVASDLGLHCSPESHKKMISLYVYENKHNVTPLFTCNDITIHHILCACHLSHIIWTQNYTLRLGVK